MDRIVKVPKNISGREDAVETMSSCAMCKFELDKNGKPVKMTDLPKMYPCKIMASCSNGTISISAHEIGVMLTVQMDEISEVINAAVFAYIGGQEK